MNKLICIKVTEVVYPLWFFNFFLYSDFLCEHLVIWLIYDIFNIKYFLNLICNTKF